MNKSLNTLGWQQRFAVMEAHPELNDDQCCTLFGTTPDELKTAVELKDNGTFEVDSAFDVDQYESVIDSIKAPVSDTPVATSTTKPLTATKAVKEPQKRGRKGSRIANAFDAIPYDPTDANQFATDNNVSLAVLKQSGRFDKCPDKGKVHVRKDKETKVLQIWRTKP